MLIYIYVFAACFSMHAAAPQQKSDFNPLIIERLNKRSKHINSAIKMWQEAIGKELPADDAKRQINKSPLALIALLNGEPVGLSTLQNNHSEKNPWLSIFVATAYRRQGIGKMLLLKTIHFAQGTFGLDRAYAHLKKCSSIEALCTKKGCKKIEDTTRDGQPTVSMQLELEQIRMDIQLPIIQRAILKIFTLAPYCKRIVREHGEKRPEYYKKANKNDIVAMRELAYTDPESSHLLVCLYWASKALDQYAQNDK